MSIAAKCNCGNSPSGFCHGNKEWGCTMSFGEDVPLYSIKEFKNLQSQLTEKDRTIAELREGLERIANNRFEGLDAIEIAIQTLFKTKK